MAGASSGAVAQEQSPTQGVLKSLNMTQDAWNGKLRARGESTLKPGYVRYFYDPENVFPIRTRESMITTVKLPEGDKLTQAFSGDDQGFQVGIPTPNSIAIKALYPGVDTNIVAYTEDGKVYTFYVRSEGYNSKTISDFLVDVVIPGEGVVEGYQMSATPQARSAGETRYPAKTAENTRDPYASDPISKSELYRDYAESTDFDPKTIVEDIGVYVPKGMSGGTIPYRVFHDDRFTYVDYGTNASQMTEWPTASIVIQGVEGPVGFRTGGPGGRMIILESLGDFALRNGQRVIYLRPRKNVTLADKKTLIEYPVASRSAMSIPTDLPPGRVDPRESKPQTVKPIKTAQATVHGEPPSKVVALPEVRTKPVIAAASSNVVVEEIKPKGEGAPIRSVVTTGAIKTIDIPASTTPAAVATASPMAQGVAMNPAAVALKPTVNASALSGYYISAGSGTEADLSDRWKSYKVQYYADLNGKRVDYVPTEGGRMEMRILPISNVAEGMKICAALAPEGKPCNVKNAK